MEKQLSAAERDRPHRALRHRRAQADADQAAMLNGRVVRRARTSRPATTRPGLTLPNAAHATYRVPVDAEYVVRAVTRRPPAAGLDADDVRAVGRRRAGRRRRTLDPEPGAPASSRASRTSAASRVEFRLQLTAGEHWIAGAPLRLFEGLPAKLRRPDAVDAAAAAAAGVQAAAGHDARADRVRAEALRGAADRAHGRQRRRASAASRSSGPYGYEGRPSAESRARIYTCGHAGRARRRRAGCRSCRRWRGAPSAGR